MIYMDACTVCIHLPRFNPSAPEFNPSMQQFGRHVWISMVRYVFKKKACGRSLTALPRFGFFAPLRPIASESLNSPSISLFYLGRTIPPGPRQMEAVCFSFKSLRIRGYSHREQGQLIKSYRDACTLVSGIQAVSDPLGDDQ